MEIVWIFNGLGNQMSQYAFYLAKKKLNKNIKAIFLPSRKGIYPHNGLELEKLFDIQLDKSKSGLLYGYIYRLGRRFPILNKLFSTLGARTIIEAPNYDFDGELIDPAKGIINFYYGGWHSEKYFKAISDEIKEVFKFDISKEDSTFQKLAEEISVDQNSVSIHIRRGDYLTPISAHFNGISTEEYYDKAIKFIKSKVKNPNFYIFSNDIQWCKEKFKGDNFQIIECNTKENSWRDMYLMSQCRHHIIANSTFSWWAAWLSPHTGYTLRPDGFIRTEETKDIYPHNWICIK